MKAIFTLILLISPALAQDYPGQNGAADKEAAQKATAISRAITACGPVDTQFQVKIDWNQHLLAGADAGKALVYVIEDQKTRFVRDVTIRVGLDGAWMGADRGDSYFFFAVDPGVHHLCADWKTSSDHDEPIIALANFTAEAGKVYYFRARPWGSVQDSWLNREPGRYLVLDLDPVNDDQGRLMVASSGFSTSRLKK